MIFSICVYLQGVATLLLYPHFEPLREIDGSDFTPNRVHF